jgi:hypothetical protein
LKAEIRRVDGNYKVLVRITPPRTLLWLEPVFTNYSFVYRADRPAASNCRLPGCRTAGMNSYPLFEQPGQAEDSHTIGTGSSNQAATR